MGFLFSYSFWFNSGSVMPFYVGLLFILSIFTLIASILLYGFRGKFTDYSKALRVLISRLQEFFLTFGFLGVLWSVFYYEGAYILSMKLWLLIIGIIAVVRLIMIALAYRKESIPIQVNQAERLYRKYLPR